MERNTSEYKQLQNYLTNRVIERPSNAEMKQTKKMGSRPKEKKESVKEIKETFIER